ncbi:MAG: hypothetical protein IJA34_09325 [Lachnospiraceae bacterium]|nr:hypothetical protein [Lachnospiraceae bacterium]
MIISILNSNIETQLEEYKNFHIGEFIEEPNQCGCFNRNDSWYIYSIDERNFCTFTGPFGLNGIIYACAKLLHFAKKFREYKFSEEELEIYINNNFHSFDEIDNYK